MIILPLYFRWKRGLSKDFSTLELSQKAKKRLFYDFSDHLCQLSDYQHFIREFTFNLEIKT